MFKIEAIGNLAADVEIKEAQGSKFATFRVAHSYKYKNQDGNEIEGTDWLDCTLNNVESKVLPYLKRGVKVFVRGNGSLRVYSSKAQRRMMAGCQIQVQEVELCGGSADAVPRQVVDPNDGTVHDVQKYYWTDINTSKMKKEELKELLDVRGTLYVMNKQGFVAPKQTEPEPQEEDTNEAGQA